MDQKILHYLKELKQYGIKNDIPNVTEKVGRFLNMMARIKQPKNILEIGCANGYSTIWLAEAAKSVGAKIFTIEHSRPSMLEAKNNIFQTGFQDVVDIIFDDAINAINKFSPNLMFDFVFVDGEKKSYSDFWNAIQPRLTDRAVVVFDNMIAFPDKTNKFYDTIKSVDGFSQILLPMDDDGILLLIKN
jgi:predicted O-methyltransferase YrrM